MDGRPGERDLAGRYADRRVAVTGGASFIGSHLVERLVSYGAEVVVIDDLSSGQERHLAACRERIQLVIADAATPGVCTEAFAGSSAVFHLAARHGGRGYIDAHPVACATNVALDASVFHAAAAASVDNVVFTSSACAYPADLQVGSGEAGGLTEEDAGFAVRGAAFADGEYGWAKLYTELQLAAFVREGAFSGTAARLFNAYGPREDDSHALVALIGRALRQEDPFLIWGDGQQRRSFTFVDDIVTGLCLAGTVDGFEVVNVGTPHAVTIDELCELVFEALGWRPKAIHHDLGRPVGPSVRLPDVTKVQALFGWSPEVPLSVGLAPTIDALRARLAEPTSGLR